MNSLDKMEDYDRLKQERDELAKKVVVFEQNHKRYERLRIIGVAPNESKQLKNRTVIRFQSLDVYCDKELSLHATRGEAK